LSLLDVLDCKKSYW